MACLFYASLNIPLATTSLLANTSVFFTGVLAHFFLGERLTARRLALVLCGFASVGLVLVDGIVDAQGGAGSASNQGVARGVTASLGYGFGYGAALASGFLTSVAYFSVRKLKEVPANLVILSLALAGMFLPWLGLLLPSGLTWPQTQAGWALLLVSSAPALLGQITMTAALRLGPAGVVSTGQYMGPVFGVAAGILFFQESLSTLKLLGGLGVICFGVAIPVMRGHRLGHRLRK